MSLRTGPHTSLGPRARRGGIDNGTAPVDCVGDHAWMSGYSWRMKRQKGMQGTTLLNPQQLVLCLSCTLAVIHLVYLIYNRGEGDTDPGDLPETFEAGGAG